MKSILLAFALFTRIPMPAMELREENTRHLMAAFPLTGVAVGLAVIAWTWLAGTFGFGAFLYGAGTALLPLAVSGGIHMDGFCDTADAIASHGDIEKKQRILKDPHAGAFAATAAAAYLLAFAALAGEGFGRPALLYAFALAFPLSRALSALAVVTFPYAPQSSLGKQFHDTAAKKTDTALILLWLIVIAAAMTMLGGTAGLAAAAAPLALFAYWKKFAMKHFGGMSGDLSGCLLQLCELLSLAALVIVPKILEKA